VKKENPEVTFGEVGKVLGEKWKNISASDKAKYEEMAKKDKVCHSSAHSSKSKQHYIGSVQIM